MKKSLYFVFFVFLFFLAVIFISPKITKAYNSREAVLGDSAPLFAQIPPTTQGPGLILPDSPLFFLDKLKQSVRLFLAFTPEQKARVYVSVAGERLAELRFMLEDKNREGIYTDLHGIADNLRGAENQLALAKLSGRDVSVLAREINTAIREDQDDLDILAKNETGSLKDEVIASQKSIMESKVAVENYLPSQDLLGEITDDLNREMAENLDQTKTSAGEIQREFSYLQKYSDDQVGKKLTAEQDDLKNAMLAKNINLANSTSRLIQAEKQLQSEILSAQQKTSQDTQEVLNKVYQAQQDLGKVDSLISQIKSNSMRAKVSK